MADLNEWLKEFRVLHAKAARGALSPQEQSDYHAGRDELARALLAAQKVQLKPGQTARQTLRVARALQVDLESQLMKLRAMTVDLSVSGFSVLIAKAPSKDEEILANIRVPGADPIVEPVVVLDARTQPGNVRISFGFRKLSDADRERLEWLVFETVLSQMA